MAGIVRSSFILSYNVYVLWFDGRHSAADGVMIVLSRRRGYRRVRMIVSIVVSPRKNCNKKRPPCPKRTQRTSKTRGTTSVYRFRGLIGYNHIRSAVSGAPGAAYHFREASGRSSGR